MLNSHRHSYITIGPNAKLTYKISYYRFTAKFIPLRVRSQVLNYYSLSDAHTTVATTLGMAVWHACLCTPLSMSTEWSLGCQSLGF